MKVIEFKFAKIIYIFLKSLIEKKVMKLKTNSIIKILYCSFLINKVFVTISFFSNKDISLNICFNEFSSSALKYFHHVDSQIFISISSLSHQTFSFFVLR